MLSTLSGTIINRAQLGRSLNISEGSVRNYLDIAHGTMVWRNIPAFHHSKVKSLIKMPKGVLRDSGLGNYLQGTTTVDALHHAPNVGSRFESFVIEEILRGVEASSAIGWEYSHHRSRAGAEIDLILRGAFGLVPIEIKYGTHPAAPAQGAPHVYRHPRAPLRHRRQQRGAGGAAGRPRHPGAGDFFVTAMRFIRPSPADAPTKKNPPPDQSSTRASVCPPEPSVIGRIRVLKNQSRCG